MRNWHFLVMPTICLHNRDVKLTFFSHFHHVRVLSRFTKHNILTFLCTSNLEEKVADEVVGGGDFSITGMISITRWGGDFHKVSERNTHTQANMITNMENTLTHTEPHISCVHLGPKSRCLISPSSRSDRQWPWHRNTSTQHTNTYTLKPTHTHQTPTHTHTLTYICIDNHTLAQSDNMHQTPQHELYYQDTLIMLK